MAEIKETVTTSQDSVVSDTGANVQQETRKVDTQVAADGKTTAANLVKYAVGLVVVLLAFRLVLKLFGANPSSGLRRLPLWPHGRTDRSIQFDIQRSNPRHRRRCGLSL